ncbi:MAG: Polysaccharide biosynthesis protein [Mucilaginibacter sp.]|nr:Polysaccharide biosynthesis protein [Mucilaginibacter sp.]
MLCAAIFQYRSKHSITLLKKLLNTTSLKANIVANFVGNGWGALISIIFVPLYLRYIGAEGYGLIGIFASLQVVLSLLDSGLSTTLNKEIARLSVLPDTQQQMRNLVKTLGSVYWGLALVAGVIALGLSPLLAKYWVHSKELGVSTITLAFILLSISLVFQFPTGFYSGGLLGLHRQVALNIIWIVFSTIKSVGAILILIFVSKSVLTFFEWNLFIIILQAFTLKFFLWRNLPKAELKAIFDKQELKKIWRFAAGMAGISLTAILLTQIDKIILSKILTLEQFGYYTISCSLGLMIYQIISPLTQSYFPKFSNLISLNKIEELKALYHQACQMISLLVLPATFILVFFSKELIFIWTKNSITTENTWMITAIYAYGTGMNGLMNIPYLLTLSYGWTKLGFYQNILFLILMIPLTIFLALTFGAIGGALSWATINTLYFFVTPYLIHRKLLIGEIFNWYWKDIILPFLACITIIVGIKYFVFTTVYSRWVELLLIVLVSVLSVIGIIPFADKLRNNVFNVLKKVKSND